MRVFPLLILATALPSALLRAAPVPKDFGEVVEAFVWKGEKRARTVRTLVLGGEKMEFVKVPSGKFEMGSPDADKHDQTDDRPRHTVTFTKPLWVGKHPVTKGQFAAFVKATGHKTEAEKNGRGGMGFDGRDFRQDEKYDWRASGWEQTDRHPVVNVSWDDAAAYTAWASKDGKKAIRLMTEAEYEYANRGGTATRYFTGDDPESLDGYANVADACAKAKWDCPFAAEFDDGQPFTSPVGKFKPNGFGLHDTTGNVWCWCADWYDSGLYPRGKDGVTDPKPNADGERAYRACRGGSWRNPATHGYAARRGGIEPTVCSVSTGFRVCAEAE